MSGHHPHLANSDILSSCARSARSPVVTRRMNLIVSKNFFWPWRKFCCCHCCLLSDLPKMAHMNLALTRRGRQCLYLKRRPNASPEARNGARVLDEAKVRKEVLRLFPGERLAAQICGCFLSRRRNLTRLRRKVRFEITILLRSHIFPRSMRSKSPSDL